MFLAALAFATLLLLPSSNAAAAGAPARGSMVRTWVARPGDTPESIARRFHMSVRELRQRNPGLADDVPPGTALYVQLPMAVGTRVGSRSVHRTALQAPPPAGDDVADTAAAPHPPEAPGAVDPPGPPGGYALRSGGGYGRASGHGRAGGYGPAGGYRYGGGRGGGALHAPAGVRGGGFAPVSPRWDGPVARPYGAPVPLDGAPGALRGVAAGAPQDGRLVDPVRLPDVPAIHIRRPERAYGTGRLVQAVLRAVASVERRFPETQVIAIGDLSAPQGGPLPGHKSHQNGRDVDVAYYTRDESTDEQFVDLTPGNLDTARTWAFIEALLDSGDLQFIFIDHALQAPLYEYAAAHASPRWRTPDALAHVFQYPMPEWAGVGVIRHEPHHGDHMHVRIQDSDAPEDVAGR